MSDVTFDHTREEMWVGKRSEFFIWVHHYVVIRFVRENSLSDDDGLRSFVQRELCGIVGCTCFRDIDIEEFYVDRWRYFYFNSEESLTKFMMTYV